MASIQTYLAAASPVIALVGVLLGARLNERQQRSNWLRDQRQRIYFEYIVEFHELQKQFGTNKKLMKFGGPEAVGDGPRAWVRYQDQLEKLLELRTKVDLLSGRRVDKRMGDSSYAISRMLEVDSDDSATTDRSI